MRVLGDFTDTGDALLVGSDEGEIAIGKPAIEAFFLRLFARDAAFSWSDQRVEATRSGDVLCFFADGLIRADGQGGSKTAPYRISGILKRSGESWLWSHDHGSEPVRAP
jgi:ketosteroid isomerase-like protein